MESTVLWWSFYLKRGSRPVQVKSSHVMRLHGTLIPALKQSCLHVKAFADADRKRLGVWSSFLSDLTLSSFGIINVQPALIPGVLTGSFLAKHAVLVVFTVICAIAVFITECAFVSGIVSASWD